MKEFAKLLGPVARRIGNMLARGTLAASDSSRKMQSAQVRLLAGEVLGDLEHFEPFGFTSCPRDGAELIAAFLGGDRSHGVVLVVADRRYRLTGLKSGEVAIHDDLGQKVHLTRNGIVVDGAGHDLTVTNTPQVSVTAATKMVIDTPELEVTGNVKAGGDVTDNANSNAKTMADMRGVHNAHDHNENNVSGSPSGKPNQLA